MNLILQRQYINEEAIFNFVEKYHWKLILPDQDIINALYANLIKPLDEIIYNYDVRRYRFYKYKTKGFCNMDYVIHHTVFLHYCGKKKPWHNNYQALFMPYINIMKNLRFNINR